MASTKTVNTVASRKAKSLNVRQIEQLQKQLEQKLSQYKRDNGEEYPLELVEKTENKEAYDYVNPQHYVQEDGRQTWEHMWDDKGAIVTAIFCDTNSYKYNDRIGKKPNEDATREKAKIDWYDGKFTELLEFVNENSEAEFKNLAKYLSEELGFEIEVRKKNIWS